MLATLRIFVHAGKDNIPQLSMKSNQSVYKGHTKLMDISLLRGGGSARGFSYLLPNQSISKDNTNNNPDDENILPFLPIRKYEIRQFVSMSLMMFLFIYVYTTVRDTKDTLVVSKCGAESIPFLKMYGVMPAAFLFIMGYSKLATIFSKQSLFYIALIPFFAFYSIFAFILFPNRDIIHFISARTLEESPSLFKGITNSALGLIRYWSYSVYFIVSELWASAGVPLLFWQVSEKVELLIFSHDILSMKKKLTQNY